MRISMIKSILAMLVMTIIAAMPARAETPEEVCQALFVHNAQHVSMSGTTITMAGASPIVIYFCDRPVRMAGHLSIAEFISSVSKGGDSFAKNPPNAVLSIIDGSEFFDVVVELAKAPRVDGDTLTFTDVRIVEGEVPTVEGMGSLFIDVIGRPLSPMSIAGVHRRHVRRAVRRCAAGLTCY